MSERHRPSVLMVTGAYFPEIGTSGLQSRQAARILRDRVEVRVLTTAVDPSLAKRATIDDVEVSRVTVDVASRTSKIAASLRMLAEAARLLRQSDVVHLHSFSQKNILMTWLARRLGVPIVLSLHTSGHDEPQTVDRQGRLARWALRAADRYLCVSAPIADACRAAGFPPAKIRIVPTAVDVERFRPSMPEERPALRRSLGIEPDRPMVLFVGFFSREKQPQVLFDAWLRLQAEGAPATTLVFVGATRSAYFEVDASIADDMRARASTAGVADRLVFAGQTDRVDEYYRAADVFALPSSREGLPAALLEAMASGLPCIASRLPGVTDVVIEDQVSGILVPPGDAAALAAALGRLLVDRAAAQALAAAARSRVTGEFSAESVAGRWLEAYRSVSPRFA